MANEGLGIGDWALGAGASRVWARLSLIELWFIRKLRTWGRGVRFQNKGVCVDPGISLGLADRGTQKGHWTKTATRRSCNTSRALLASNPIERREGPCFPLEIAALSLVASGMTRQRHDLTL